MLPGISRPMAVEYTTFELGLRVCGLGFIGFRFRGLGAFNMI